jgi:hypothetical protein
MTVRRMGVVVCLCAAIFVSGWLVVGAGAQSTMVAPFFREVNSAAILSAIQGISGGGTAEDTAHSTGDLGSVSLCVRDDTLDARSGAENDYEPCHTNSTGALWVAEDTGSALSVDIDAIRTATESASTSLDNIETNLSQDAVHDNAARSAGPQIIFEAKDFDGSALPNVVSAEGDAVRGGASLYGINYAMLVNEDGSKQLGKLEDDAHATADFGLPFFSRRRDTAAASSGTEGDYQTIDSDSLGRVWVRDGNPCADHARVSSVAIDTAASGNVALVTFNSGDTIYVCGYDVVVSGAVSIQFVYGDDAGCATNETNLTGPMAFAANGGISVPNTGSVQFKTAASKELCVELSGAVQTSGILKYVKTAAP